jgi:hypothetical protein
MPEPEPMYPKLTGIWAMKGADADGLLLVELQTVTKPLRFSITIADAFQVAEKLVMAAMGARD